MNEDDGYVYTEMSHALLDRMLDHNSFLVDKWDLILAWHKAQRDYFATRFALAEARATMAWSGAVGKAKAAAACAPEVERARICMDVAAAQLGLCERRAHSLEKEAINLALRNKLLQTSYNNTR